MREAMMSKRQLVAVTACVALLIAASFAVVSGSKDDSTRNLGIALLGVLVAVIAIFAQPLFSDWLSRRRQARHANSDVRRLVNSTRSDGPSSQLASLVALREVISMRFQPIDIRYETGTPRLKISGAPGSTHALAMQWIESPDRLVILGEAGYGKTTAALAILHKANNTSDVTAPVVELFALNEWYQFHLEYPAKGLSAWMARELFRTYGLNQLEAIRLIDSGQLLPVLDGLDEIPIDGCSECIKAITGYAGKTSPPRPFILTCRIDRYQEIAREWLSHDHQVTVLGLDAQQIVDVIQAEAGNSVNWAKATSMLVSGDGGLGRVLASPLRLSIALQTYHTGDPTELASMSPSNATARLWERLLTDPRWSFEGHESTKIRSWLAWLARSMELSGRQYFWPHELYLYAPDRSTTAARFRLRLGLVSEALILPAIVVFGIATNSDARAVIVVVSVVFLLFLFGRIVFAITSVPMARTLFGLGSGDEPTRRVRVPWRDRRRDAPASLAIVPMAALLFGVGTGLVGGLRAAMAGALIGTLGGLFVALFGPPVAPVEDHSTQPLKVVTSANVLRESALNGVRWGLAGMLVTGLVGGLCGLATGGPDLVALVAFAGALLGGVTALLSGGLDAWLYHHWLRRHMAKLGFTPRNLDGFLQWCSAPERQWIRRAGGSFQFRHRELQEYLAARATAN